MQRTPLYILFFTALLTFIAALAGAALIAGQVAKADLVTDWNITACEIAVAVKLPPAPTYRIMAMVQSSVYEDVNAITKRYPPDRVKLDAAPGASVDAAVAAANRSMLSKLVPSQQATIDSTYQAALSTVSDEMAKKKERIAVGERAAAAIFALRGDEGADAQESYRPSTTAGVYVPTVIPSCRMKPRGI